MNFDKNQEIALKNYKYSSNNDNKYHQGGCDHHAPESFKKWN